MGTDGGTDLTIERRPGLDPDLDREVDGLDVRQLDVELDRVVDGLRLGDLAFVAAAALRLGPAIGVCLVAAGAVVADSRVTDVAFALADLAADPATTDWSPGELLAAAVAQVVGALGSASDPAR
jgi:hypothetical protein